ncbi:MAG TPA: Rieske 2Fe-2S domain-containing protein [Dongiaceae bacterium]|nr:Rieske 2Fe-2S domain-containing protein [Dongiaceae bacterium]
MVVLEKTDGFILTVGNERYFPLNTGRRVYLCRAACPHRGGPIYQGTNVNDTHLVCPTHRIAYPISAITRQALPTVKKGKHLTIMIDCHVPWKIQQKKVLINEPHTTTT